MNRRGQKCKQKKQINDTEKNRGDVGLATSTPLL